MKTFAKDNENLYSTLTDKQIDYIFHRRQIETIKRDVLRFFHNVTEAEAETVAERYVDNDKRDKGATTSGYYTDLFDLIGECRTEAIMEEFR